MAEEGGEPVEARVGAEAVAADALAARKELVDAAFTSTTVPQLKYVVKEELSGEEAAEMSDAAKDERVYGELVSLHLSESQRQRSSPSVSVERLPTNLHKLTHSPSIPWLPH